MARTPKDGTGHTHKVSEKKLTGRTSIDRGHDHFADWGKKRTGMGGDPRHDHPMPKVPKAIQIKLKG